ncbi:uncharacterized protein LOC132630853 [Lycium barbarum]|uniref:uncharacterized protein LOC132630853 n=1 Tax=Lycium barbarum TaxID=112863 RepID=UPI00293E1647|nr:uncharacterized protein LOC132630853 [Lycium barbarum]
MTNETNNSGSSTGTDAASEPAVINSNHAYFLHSSDSPGMALVNNLFDGRGYQGWKRSVLIALSAKNKLGFITGAHLPPDSTSPDLQPWSRCNDMVTSWPLNSLSKDNADSVIYSRTTKEHWTSLEHRFGQSNGEKLFHLQQELTRLVQGTNNIAGYFTKLKRLWDELDSLNSSFKCTCVCNCEGKEKLEKSLEDERLIQFLMGLNDVYAQARGNILMLNPLPNINHGYSLISQDENQRETYMSSIVPSDSTSFTVGNFNQYKNGKQVQRYPGSGFGSGPKPNANYPRMNNAQQPTNYSRMNNIQQPTRFSKQNQKFKGKKKFNPNVSCAYCGKVGYVMDDCHRLHEYPDDFQFTNEKKYAGNIKGNVVTSEEPENNNYIDLETINQHMNKEQLKHFVHMVKQFKGLESSQANTRSEINANAVVGTITKYFGKCFLVFNSSTWIIDSGKVSIYSDLILHNVLYVPSFKYNLLSVHKFTIQFECAMFFTSTACMLQGSLMKRIQVFGQAKEGLYLLQPNPKESSSNHEVSLKSQSFSSFSSQDHLPVSVCSNVSSNVNLWHVRLGHLPYSSMKNVSFISIPLDSTCHCEICPQARQTRLPFPTSQITSKSVLN